MPNGRRFRKGDSLKSAHVLREEGRHPRPVPHEQAEIDDQDKEQDAEEKAQPEESDG